MFSKWKSPQGVFSVWAGLALIVLWPVAQLLNGSFPNFTVVWIVIPLAAVWRAKEASRVGFRAVPWRLLAQTTLINLAGLLGLMLLFEPWSHTYQKLLSLALSGQSPDTTFAWLLRLSRVDRRPG